MLTGPDYFNGAQRQSTKDAGTMAGLNVARNANDLTSVTIAYGIGKKTGKNILEYDLGGGTLNALRGRRNQRRHPLWR